jgi:hypothetical protein
MDNTGLIPYIDYNRHWLNMSPQLTSWKYLDGRITLISPIVASIPLKNKDITVFIN